MRVGQWVELINLRPLTRMYRVMAGGRDVLFFLLLLLLSPVSSDEKKNSLPPFTARVGEAFVYLYQSSAQISRELGANLTAEVSGLTKSYVLLSLKQLVVK